MKTKLIFISTLTIITFTLTSEGQTDADDCCGNVWKDNCCAVMDSGDSKSCEKRCGKYSDDPQGYCNCI